jgi:DNA replication and repair protein RecF
VDGHALPVGRIEVRGFRNLDDAPIELGDGVNLLHGPNGAGKTNILEAVYFALIGQSCRTSNEREMIAFGGSLARVEAIVGQPDGGSATFLAAISSGPGAEKRHTVDGSALNADGIARRPPIAVFMPDRLALVKGPPANRRAFVDRFSAALAPARADARVRFGRALAQRNALLSRIRAGAASPDSLDAWDLELAREGRRLIEARAAAVAAIAPTFTEVAQELGLPGEAELRYAPRVAETGVDEFVAELGNRRAGDIDRARTGYGPHLDEIDVRVAGRAARRFSSQGEQRAALLAMLFAQRDALLSERGIAPLLLLDDVCSELDPGRRDLLATRLAAGGQTILTATEAAHLPERARRREIAVSGGRASGGPLLEEVA